MKIRDGVQEYPDKSLEEAFMDKIKEIQDGESKGEYLRELVKRVRLIVAIF